MKNVHHGNYLAPSQELDTNGLPNSKVFIDSCKHLFKTRNGNGMLPLSLLLHLVSLSQVNQDQEQDLISFQLSIHHSLALGHSNLIYSWIFLDCKLRLRPLHWSLLVTRLAHESVHCSGSSQLFASFPSSQEVKGKSNGSCYIWNKFPQDSSRNPTQCAPAECQARW